MPRGEAASLGCKCALSELRYCDSAVIERLLTTSNQKQSKHERAWEPQWDWVWLMDSCAVGTCTSHMSWSRIQCLVVAFTASRVVSRDHTKQRCLHSWNRMRNPLPVRGRCDKKSNQVQEDSQEVSLHFPSPALFILTSRGKGKWLELPLFSPQVADSEGTVQFDGDGYAMVSRPIRWNPNISTVMFKFRTFSSNALLMYLATDDLVRTAS